MKIGLFTDTYYPQLNGVTVSIDNFARELRRKGHTVYIFAPKIKGFKETNKDVFRLPSIKILSSEPEVRFPTMTSYRNILKFIQMDFDVVHAHGNGPFSILGYQVAKGKGIPYILTFHTLHTEYTHYFLKGKVIKPHMIATGLKMFARLCDGILTPSEKMKNKLIEFGVTKKITVIPNFVDLSKLHHAKKGYLHSLLDLPESTPIILSVGRLGKEKNFPFVIKVFSEVVKKDSKVHLVIVGPGPEKDNLKRLTREYNLNDRLHFTDKIDAKDMPRVYADADVFVFASTTEVHAIVTLEAAASGLPIVAVKDEAFKHTIEDGKNGFLLPLVVPSFAEKILLLLKDNSLRNSMGINSQKMIEKNFQGEKLTDQLVLYYKEVIRNYKPSAKVLRRVNRMAFSGIMKTSRALDRLFLFAR